MFAKTMVETQVEARGVKDRLVLEAMRAVPRERFVPEDYKKFAYSDCPLPIDKGQTISQPYMVAAMTEYLGVHDGSRALEIGTGSGYQTAVLAEIVDRVYTVEIVRELAVRARILLEEMGYGNISYKIGDGYHGWPQHEPYDAIIVTAAPAELPPGLGEQLKIGGKMVIPVGPTCEFQNLYVMEKQADGRLIKKDVMAVRFVPLTGDH